MPDQKSSTKKGPSPSQTLRKAAYSFLGRLRKGRERNTTKDAVFRATEAGGLWPERSDWLSSLGSHSKKKMLSFSERTTESWEQEEANIAEAEAAAPARTARSYTGNLPFNYPPLPPPPPQSQPEGPPP